MSTWNTGAVTNLTDMFLNASAFNQNLSAWNFESVSPVRPVPQQQWLANLNEASGIYNYNQFLCGWQAKTYCLELHPRSIHRPLSTLTAWRQQLAQR